MRKWILLFQSEKEFTKHSNELSKGEVGTSGEAEASFLCPLLIYESNYHITQHYHTG